MCDPTGGTATMIVGMALKAASTVMGAAAQQQEIDRQYNEAVARKKLNDQISSQKLKAERDRAAIEAGRVKEQTLQEQTQIRKNAIMDTGEVLARSSALGVAGFDVSNLIDDMYRAESNALNVSEQNQKAQLNNIANEVAGAETTHRYNLASGTPSKASGTSGIVMALDIGSAAAGDASDYYAARGAVGSNVSSRLAGSQVSNPKWTGLQKHYGI